MNSENVDKKLAQSIILKRSPCLWRQSHGKEEPPEEDTSKEVECEAILLTNGLILATVLGSTKKSNAIRLQFERAILWSQVSYVQPYPSADKPTEWQLFLDDNVVWTFACASAKQQDYWLRALERVLVEYHMHTGRTSGLGWQYRFIHKPAFSMAVDPDRMDAVRPPAAALSKLDRYNGYTPLHYAVTLYNVTAVKCLLKIGADPNQPDKEEGVTPTDLAVRDEKTPPAILELLTSRGGEIHENMKTGRGALFGQVAAVEEKKEKERRELQQKKEAESAQQQMNENMRLLQQRGEQINEMGSKATELNQGAQDFGSLATKLKEKSKKQNSWMPF